MEKKKLRSVKEKIERGCQRAIKKGAHINLTNFGVHLNHDTHEIVFSNLTKSVCPLGAFFVGQKMTSEEFEISCGDTYAYLANKLLGLNEDEMRSFYRGFDCTRPSVESSAFFFEERTDQDLMHLGRKFREKYFPLEPSKP